MARLSVSFPPGTLKDACEQLGLTSREIRFEMGISESTWARWKETDRIPIERLTDVVLMFELDEPEGLENWIPRIAWRYLAAVRQATGDLEELLRRIGRIEDRLGIPPDDDRDAPRSG